MRTKLRIWYSENKNIYNLTKYILVSLVLLAVVWIIDVQYPVLQRYIPDYMLLEAKTSETFLSNLSGVFLSISTFTFTTILTVLSMYNSNWSPRILQNFVEKPIVFKVLGTFIGGFFYTILSLFILKNTIDVEKVISGSAGIVYAIFSMINFIRFVREVIRDVKSANIVDDIYKKGLGLAQKEAKLRNASRMLPEEEIDQTIEIYAQNTGYLHSIDYDALINVLSHLHGDVVLQAQIGEFVTKGQYIAKLNLVENDELHNRDEEELIEDIASHFYLQSSRNDEVDYRNEISDLVDIATRALSPGTNDPNTAIGVVRKLTHLLGELFVAQSNSIVAKEDETTRIIYVSATVKEELYHTFNQLITYGKTDPSFMTALLEGLQVVYMMAADENRRAIKEFYEAVFTTAMNHMEEELDREHVRSLKEKFFNRHEFANEDKMQEEEEA